MAWICHRHSVTKLVVHLIFCTKYRRKLLDGAMNARIREAMQYAVGRLDIEILEMDSAPAEHYRLKQSNTGVLWSR
ncbi:hypothetical protein AIR33_21350 [Salmonella enterica]|nr:hypothetical protein [Salmonella enterica]EEJ9029309.1 hypothetical protein [Salmonella enterica subsp. enterica]